ncbi:prealbumin-like fold domain-containing protein [Streptomyces spectabilis]|uniref:MSCRAMM family protein n=1 Tax=Streptomyces spectabilis TaxID=68270 RepID=UPI0033ED6A3C
MHIRNTRLLPAAVITVATTVTGPLVWAPAASAQAQAPAPNPTASAFVTPAPDAAENGGVAILKKDPGGDVLAGASFTLYNSEGKAAGSGKTDAEGRLVFKQLPPGIYRLKEVSSGSPLHDIVEDQDVIVTPGTDASLTLTVIDPFKPANVLVKAQNGKSGKLLPGATVNIGMGAKTLLTLTTGNNGTATAKLPVNTRTGTVFWAKQTKAPANQEPDEGRHNFTAKPGDQVTVTFTNAKTHTTPSPPAPSGKPSGRPTEEPTRKSTDKPTEKPTSGSSDVREPSKPPADAPAAPVPDKPTSSATAHKPDGSLAHTGADATPWLLAGAGALLAVGGGILIATRRRRTDDSTDESGAEN